MNAHRIAGTLLCSAWFGAWACATSGAKDTPQDAARDAAASTPVVADAQEPGDGPPRDASQPGDDARADDDAATSSAGPLVAGRVHVAFNGRVSDCAVAFRLFSANADEVDGEATASNCVGVGNELDALVFSVSESPQSAVPTDCNRTVGFPPTSFQVTATLKDGSTHLYLATPGVPLAQPCTWTAVGAGGYTDLGDSITVPKEIKGDIDVEVRSTSSAATTRMRIGYWLNTNLQ